MALNPLKSAPAPDCDPCPVVKDLKATVDDHGTRIKDLEELSGKIDGVIAAVEAIGRQVRFWAPTMIAAAISAGIVNGKLAEFLRALLQVNGN
jgi:hypothetical protein